MSWRQILSFFCKHTLTDHDWYQHLAFCFNSPKVSMCWHIKNNRLEINWYAAKLSLANKAKRGDLQLSDPDWKSNMHP